MMEDSNDNNSNDNEYDDGDHDHCNGDVDDDKKDDDAGYHLVHCCTMSLVIWVLITTETQYFNTEII